MASRGHATRPILYTPSLIDTCGENVMARINISMVHQLRLAVMKLASVGPFQERLKEALDEVRAFRITITHLR
jgi:hypothetical protein